VPLGSLPAETAVFRQFRLGGIKATWLSRKCGPTRFKTPGANFTKNSPNFNSRADSGGATLPRHGEIAVSISKCSLEDDANQRYLTTLSTNAVPRPRISRRAAKSWLRQRGDYFGDIVRPVPANDDLTPLQGAGETSSPRDSEKYRVIYADLSAGEAGAAPTVAGAFRLAP
jgi:hypothetical protein